MRGKVILTRSKTHGWVEVERKRVDESLRKVAESRIWTVVEGRHIELNAILKSSCYEEGLGEVAYASLHKPTEAYRNLCHYALIIGNEDPPDTIRSWSKRRYISVWNLWISSLALLLRDYSPTDLMLVSVANDFYAGLHSGASSTWLKLVSRWRTTSKGGQYIQNEDKDDFSRGGWLISSWENLNPLGIWGWLIDQMSR